MKFMLLIYGNETAWNTLSQDAMDNLERTHATLQAELSASGELIETSALAVPDAHVVRTHQGAALVTDGPFTEAKEIVAGYYILDCADSERATTIAARFAEAEFAPIDVRRIKS